MLGPCVCLKWDQIARCLTQDICLCSFQAQLQVKLCNPRSRAMIYAPPNSYRTMKVPFSPTRLFFGLIFYRIDIRGFFIPEISLPSPAVPLSETKLLLRLDSWMNPGLSRDQFFGLFGKCRRCGLYMTRQTVGNHDCRGLH
jgi:hypothetical protein